MAPLVHSYIISCQSVFCKVMFTLRKRLTLAYWVPFAQFHFTHALYVFTLAHFTLLYYNILLVRTII